MAVLPDRWLALSVGAPPRERVHLLVDTLYRLGGRVIEREGGRLVALLPPPADPALLLAEARAAIRAGAGIAEPDVAWAWRPARAMAAAWLRDTPVRRVTDRIVVAPAGATADTGAAVVVRLVPGPAFGNAGHATTRACLRLLERWLRPGETVADAGTGSGILAIAAAMLGAGRVTACDADPLACATARLSIVASGVGDRVSVIERTVRADDRMADGPFDGILANLEARTLVGLAPWLASSLAPAGRVIASGLAVGERTTFLGAAARVGLGAVDEVVDDGWWAGVLIRAAPRA
jgi:ribosomal protein L11 methyltransferase